MASAPWHPPTSQCTHHAKVDNGVHTAHHHPVLLHRCHSLQHQAVHAAQSHRQSCAPAPCARLLCGSRLWPASGNPADAAARAGISSFIIYIQLA